MHLPYLTPSKRTYALVILTMTASMLLSCNTTPMTAMTEEDHSFGTQGTHNDGITILESVPSQEAKQEVPGEVVVAGTADGSRTDAYPDSISPSELASIERRIGLDDTESVLNDAASTHANTGMQEVRPSAATETQAIAMSPSNRQLPAARNAAVQGAMQEDLQQPDRGPQLDLIKLSAVGASAFALGGYVNQSMFNQQRGRESQTASEEATMRIRQLEEQLAAAEAEELRTAVDFYSQPATLNNNTSCQSPYFFDASRLCSVHPVWAPMGMSAFLVGGYVALKLRRCYNSLRNQLETTKQEKQAVEGQLETTRQEKQAVEGQLAESQTAVTRRLAFNEAAIVGARRMNRNLQGQLETTRQEKQAVEEQLAESQTAVTRRLAFNEAAIVGARRMNRNLQGQLETTREEKQAVEGQLAAATANVGEFLSKLDGKVIGTRNKKPWVVPVLRDRHESDYTRSLFLMAVENGSAQVVEALLQNSPDLINSNSGIWGNSALHQAALKGHDAVLGVLLANNADVNERNGVNPIVDGIISLVNPLIANPLYRVSRKTALHKAAQEGHDAAVRVLLDKGADMNAKDNDGHTALHVAASFGRSTIVQTLLNKEGIEVNAENNRGETALQHVLGRYSEEERSDSMNRVIELLRNTGAR